MAKKKTVTTHRQPKSAPAAKGSQAMKSARTWRVLLVGEDALLRRQVRESLRLLAGGKAGSSGRAARPGPDLRIVEAGDVASAIHLLRETVEQKDGFTVVLGVVGPSDRRKGLKLVRQVNELAPDLPIILSVPPGDSTWWESETQRLHPWRVSVVAHPPEPLAVRALIRVHAARGAYPGGRLDFRTAGAGAKPRSVPLDAEAADHTLLLRLVEGVVNGFCQWQAEQVPAPAETETDAETLAAWRSCRRRGAIHRAAALAAQLALTGQPAAARTPKETDLATVLEGVGMHLRHLLGDWVEVASGEKTGPVHVAADPVALHQVLCDLALLALPAFPRGARLKLHWEDLLPGEVSRRAAGPGEIRVLIEAASPRAGIGASPAPPGATSPFLTGLEWSTAQAVIGQMGGRLSRLRAPAAEPAGFEIRLPTLAPVEDSAGLAAPLAAVRGFDTLAAPAEPPPAATVLLVDDDESVRATTRLFLEEYDCRILEATDSISALRLWQEHGRNVHLLVVDLVIPGEVDGLQLARRLQAEQPGLRTLLTTGYAGPGLIEELKSLPNTEFLPKPYTYAQMHAVLRRHLRPRAVPV
jgi:CheY-like chemotaxis protein